MTAAEQAAAFAALAALLGDVYGPPGAPGRPLLVGPDTHSFRDAGSSTKAVLAYLGAFAAAAAPVLHAVTHHEYIEITAANVLNATFLDTTAAIGAAVVAAVRAAAPALQVWAGEIGPHNGGTTPNPDCAGNKVCGRFGSAVWYADSMAAKATAGYSVYCRQDVLGADYGLLNYTTRAPSPDYWLLALWKAHVRGTAVLAVSVPGAPRTVRAYAFCGGGGGGNATLVLLNLDATAAACVAPPAIAAPGAGATQFSLTAGAGGVESRDARLNGGAPLALDAAGRLPPLPGLAVAPGAAYTLPPASVTFVVVPVAGAPACSGTA